MAIVVLAQDAQIGEVIAQGVAIRRVQSVVIHNIFHVVDGMVEATLIEMAARQFPIEIGQMTLCIFVTRDLLAFVALEFRRGPQIVLRAVDNAALTFLSLSCILRQCDSCEQNGGCQSSSQRIHENTSRSSRLQPGRHCEIP